MTVSSDLPSIIDFEASGLGPQSFPIEVAWSDSQGAVQSRLIQPTFEWFCDPLAWDYNAQDLHGIPMSTLMRDGEPPMAVCEAMGLHLSPFAGVLSIAYYSDAEGFDQFWLDQLTEAAGLEGQRAIVLPIDKLIGTSSFELRLVTIRQRLNLRRHRARDDVMALLELYREVTGNN